MFNVVDPNFISLRDIIKERSSKIVFWVGSGLSIASGLPNWEELKKNIISSLKNYYSSLQDCDEKELKFRLIGNAERNNNLWISFDIMKKVSKDIYIQTIRKELSKSDLLNPSEALKHLFSIPTDFSVITFNIDSFISKVFKEITDIPPLRFTGQQCKEYLHTLRSSDRFILHSHGELANPSSWVFTETELKKLMSNVDYKSFIDKVLATRTNVFIGINARDKAISSLIKPYKGTNSNNFFWITDKTDYNTDTWAQNSGFSLIRYNNANNHSELSEMLNDIKQYLPLDKTYYKPVVKTNSSNNNTTQLLQESDLLNLFQSDYESLRNELNNYAKFILKDNTKESYDKYEQFRRIYKRSIYQCWYHDVDNPEYNTILGYKLIKLINEGAFGEVYEAVDKQGKVVALKLLKENVKDDIKMIQSFRRGVRAMQILKKNNIDGMVSYEECSEIPAFVVMELIDGVNIEEARKQKLLNDWSKILKYSSELSKIIRTAHRLPEIVLHRDIRPANIMLKKTPISQEFKVVVLDFDLSWMKESNELSIKQNNTSSGYLAPEQVDEVKGTSTRNAAVDSFGLGMTLYYIISGEHPRYNEHKLEDWKSKVRKTCNLIKNNIWVSLPYRFADLIVSATYNEQSKRIDMSSICGELENLIDANSNHLNVESQDLITYELGYRCCKELSQIESFNWDYDNHNLYLELPSGIDVHFKTNEYEKSTNVQLSWKSKGHTDSKQIHRYLPAKIEKINSILLNKSCTIKNMNFSKNEVFFDTSFSKDHLLNNMDQVVTQLIKIFKELQF